MPVYSLSDFGESHGKIRKIELEEGVTKRIWIPSADFLYKRIHFGLDKCGFYPKTTRGTLDCLNQNYGEKGEGCPICAKIQELWGKWRETKVKAEKKELQDIINRLCSEEFWMNVIDLGEPDKLMYYACRFTMSKMRDVKRVAGQFGIENVIWMYKMSKDGKKVSYTLIEDADRKDLIAKLKARLPKLNSRSYEDGGQCDLDANLLYPRSRKSFLEILSGKGNNGNYNDDDIPLEDEIVEDEETVTLDEISEDGDILDDGSIMEADDSLGLDDDESEQISLDDEGLDFDLEEDEPETKEEMVTLTASWVKEHRKEKGTMEEIFKYFLKRKFVEETEEYKNKVKSIFEYVKEKKEVEIPESVSPELAIPF